MDQIDREDVYELCQQLGVLDAVENIHDFEYSLPVFWPELFEMLGFASYDMCVVLQIWLIECNRE